jgi:hypothetical protein
MQYQEALRRLASFRESRDLDGLEHAADLLETELKKGGKQAHLAFLLQVCNLLSSIDFGNYDRQHSLIRRFAEKGLKGPAAIPVDMELQLMLLLEHASEDVHAKATTQERAEMRRARTIRWLRALQRVADEIDKNFDFNDLPELNIAPPPGAKVSAGAAPGHISDPKVRAQYEAAIANNKRKAETLTRQLQLRQMLKTIAPEAEQFIIRAYSRPPFNLAELKDLLDRHLPKNRRRDAILDIVKKQTK